MSPEVHDPDLQKILQTMNHLPPPDSVEQRRQNFARLCSFAGAPSPDVRWRDLSIPSGRTLRFYGPAGEATSALLLYFHGGGFVAGDLDTHHAALTQLCSASGVRIAHLDYRRGPEHRFPAALEDAHEAHAFLREKAREFSFDRLLVGGDSAGGNLAAALAAETRGYTTGQLLLYPTLDAHFRGVSWRTTPPGLIANAEDSAAFNALYARGPADYDDPRFSPLLQKDLAGLAPARLFAGALDAARSDSHDYAERMREAGGDARYAELAGLTHGFVTMAGALPAARRAQGLVAQAIRELAGK